MRHFFDSMKKKTRQDFCSTPYINEFSRVWEFDHEVFLQFGIWVLDHGMFLHVVICVIIYLAGFFITLPPNRPSVRPTVFFFRPKAVSKVAMIKKLRVQPWPFSLLLLSSSSLSLLLLPFSFVSVIQELQSGPKSLSFDAFSLK